MKNKKLPVVVILLVVAFFAGPRIPVDDTVQPIAIAEGPAERATPWQATEYVAAKEALFTDIRPGTAKEIVWARGRKNTRTPLSIVYIHGFSATKQEIRPVPDSVAAAFRANIFYTRLTGHGRTNEAMGEATVKSWVDDVSEAVAVGEAIGQKIVLVGTSTGATLALWAATQPELVRNVAAVVLISPNFGPNDPRADMLLWPWGKQILHAVQGDTFRWEPANEDHARFWTRAYPTDALLPMMASVKMTTNADLEGIRIPVFVAFSPEDQVVNPSRTQDALARMDPTLLDTMVVLNSLDRNKHVIAGDILSPNTSEAITRRIVSFLRATQ